MTEIIAAIITATITFAATNIDDIFVLMLFYSQTNKTFHRWHVLAGQYLGFTALVLISLLGFLGGLIVPREWIGLLGLLPIIIGIRHWLNRNRIEAETTEMPDVAKSGNFFAVVGVASVTFANGGDNIGIYTPLFASSDLMRLLIFLVVFYLLLGVWCVVSYFLTRQPLVAEVLTRYGHLIVPFVLIALGIYILIESATYRVIWRSQ
jgi:cadmium resistance transport/sequestration family protein